MIEHHGHNLILKYAHECASILELGNQIMNLEEVQGISAKQYYVSKGYSHISIDQNGRDGVIIADLGKPLKKLGYFNLITDMGTSEHVKNLYQCLRNILNQCDTGTIIIHKNPQIGSFKGHGWHYFSLEFWSAWAKLCNLEILELYPHAIYHNEVDGWECIAVLRFTKNTITPTKIQFNSILHLLNQSTEMKDYSQNGEQKFILDYFKEANFTNLNLLDIGANDGETLSNSRALMLLGWNGVLVEPSEVTVDKLHHLYKDNHRAIIVKNGISNIAGKTKFYESGTHLDQGDTSLISTTKESELERWKGSKFDNFKETEIDCITFDMLLSMTGNCNFDFITIDAEGLDYEILIQIDLAETKMLIVETNSKEDQKYIDYCEKFGLKVIHKNVENLIFAR